MKACHHQLVDASGEIICEIYGSPCANNRILVSETVTIDCDNLFEPAEGSIWR